MGEEMMMWLLPWRATLDRLLALGGAVIVIAEFWILDASPFHIPVSPFHIPVIALGTLMIYIGTWRLTGHLLYKRRNRPLRTEIHQFIGLVRQLCAHKTRADATETAKTEAALRESVERIISVA
ncbi:MAG: hypothetical protein AMS25_14510 [Gemmatimonas sp. SM23_52]|nr:MAG: hypothetical protein AMS25_14510 [Gemmatimonas sp. SM23_52]